MRHAASTGSAPPSPDFPSARCGPRRLPFLRGRARRLPMLARSRSTQIRAAAGSGCRVDAAGAAAMPARCVATRGVVSARCLIAGARARAHAISPLRCCHADVERLFALLRLMRALRAVALLPLPPRRARAAARAIYEMPRCRALLSSCSPRAPLPRRRLPRATTPPRCAAAISPPAILTRRCRCRHAGAMRMLRTPR